MSGNELNFGRTEFVIPFPRIELRLLQDSGKGDSLPLSHLGSPNRIIEDVREPDYCFIPPEFLISVDEG